MSKRLDHSLMTDEYEGLGDDYGFAYNANPLLNYSKPKKRQIAVKAVGGKETGKIVGGGSLIALAHLYTGPLPPGVEIHEMIAYMVAIIPVIQTFVRRWRKSKKELLEFILDEV